MLLRSTISKWPDGRTKRELKIRECRLPAEPLVAYLAQSVYPTFEGIRMGGSGDVGFIYHVRAEYNARSDYGMAE